VDGIKDCLEKQPGPHEHGIGNFALGNLVARLGSKCHKAAVMVFCSIDTGVGKMIFLGFSKDNQRDKERPLRAVDFATPLVEHLGNRSKLAYF
jgi:hypothetical protein